MRIEWKAPVDPMAWAPSKSAEDAPPRRITDGVKGEVDSVRRSFEAMGKAHAQYKDVAMRNIKHERESAASNAQDGGALDSEKKYRIQFCTGCAQYLLAESGQKECISCKTAFKHVGDDDPSALDTQEGGDHYKSMKIQPVEFITANDLDFLQGNVVKYIARHKAKNGAQDVRKALHYCQLILELQYGEKP